MSMSGYLQCSPKELIEANKILSPQLMKLWYMSLCLFAKTFLL